MIISHIEFQRVEIQKFSRSEGFTFRVFFNDGNNKAIDFNSNLQNHGADAHAIIQKVRKYAKEHNQSNDPGDSFLDNFVNVVIEREEEVEKKLAVFLEKVRERSRAVLGSRMATGYLDMVNQVRGLKLEF